MNHSKYEKGQALILIVFAIFGLVGLTGLTIDGGNAYSDRRHAQNAADAAVLSAALTKIRGGDWQAAGLARAADNTYDNNGDTNIVQVVSPPTSGKYAGNPDYIQVLIESHVDTYFAGVVGIHEMVNRVQAVSKTKLSSIGPLFDGEALVALKQTNDPKNPVFDNCGNSNVIVDNSGIFVNSSSACAMGAGGNSSIDVDTAVSVVNSSNPFCTNGSVEFDDPLVGGAEQVEYPPRIDLPAPSIECTDPGSWDEDTHTFYPGIYDGIHIPNGDWIFTPGNYCINGDVSLNANITANYVSFRLNDGDFDIRGDFIADHMVVYSTGTSDGMHFNANATIVATNTTFYMESGDVWWNGNADITMTAPTIGPNANMLIYLPYGNNANITINGTADGLIKGTILAVSSHVEVKGDSGSVINGQIIGYTVETCGNGDLNINYDPGDNYQQQEPAKMELTE
ncbi:MAG: Tad domain-containing protein [Anaerolineales bacterium]|nr:Tad domain-containing protein [Anaerolineales bacterium]